jgi:hypothetical protein
MFRTTLIPGGPSSLGRSDQERVPAYRYADDKQEALEQSRDCTCKFLEVVYGTITNGPVENPSARKRSLHFPPHHI